MTGWIENKYKGNLGYIPNMKIDGSQEWSMEDVFGKPPPYHPESFSKLCPRTKLFGKCVEGNNFCSNCGTLTPSTPNSHHKDCDCYLDTVEYPSVEETWWLGVCPECKTSEYETLSVHSSRELGISTISCSECTFTYQESCCEEDLVEKFLTSRED